MNERAVIRLRGMTAADVPETLPLLAQLGYEMPLDELSRRLREVLTAPDHTVLVAEIGDTVAGLLHVFVRPALENPRETVVQAIVVDEKHRGAGVGRSLMAAAERWCRERSCRSVVLSSNVARAPAHAFYQALGYHVSVTSLVFRKSSQDPSAGV